MNKVELFTFGEILGLFLVVRGQGNTNFDPRLICLAVQWPAAQSTPRNLTLYIALESTHDTDYRGLVAYFPVQSSQSHILSLARSGE